MCVITTRTNSLSDAAAIRRAVFMEEQGYKNEFDDIDQRAEHITVYVDGKPAATARCYRDENAPEIWYLGRVSTLPAFRGRGLAHRACQECEEIARGHTDARELRAHVQARLVGWYGTMGFTPISGVVDYEDEGQPHVWVSKRLR